MFFAAAVWIAAVIVVVVHWIAHPESDESGATDPEPDPRVSAELSLASLILGRPLRETP